MEIKENQRKYAILKALNEPKTYNELNGIVNGDSRKTISKLLLEEEIRVFGINKKYLTDDKGYKVNFTLSKHVLFERRLPHKYIRDIYILFKRLDSNNPDDSEKASRELIDVFKGKIREYETLEHAVINNLEKNVTRIPLNNLIDHMDLFVSEFKGKGFKSADKFIKEVEKVMNENKIKYGNHIAEDLGHYLYSYWPRESEINNWKKEIAKNKNAQIIFLKAIYTHPLVDHIPISGELPLYKLKRRYEPVLDLTGKMDSWDYLSKYDVKRIIRTNDDITNLFYKLLFYMERKNSNIIKNMFITCLSYPTSEREITEHLIIFDKLLKKVEYIPRNPKKTDSVELNELLNDGYNEEYDFYEAIGVDQFGRNKKYLNNKEGNEMENFLLFLRETYNSWKTSNK